MSTRYVYGQGGHSSNVEAKEKFNMAYKCHSRRMFDWVMVHLLVRYNRAGKHAEGEY